MSNKTIRHNNNLWEGPYHTKVCHPAGIDLAFLYIVDITSEQVCSQPLFVLIITH
jgi:hypothetical protein